MQLGLFDQTPMVMPAGLKSLNFNAPEIITKELAVARHGETRKIRLSSNWLPIMGFEAGMRHTVESLGQEQGLRLQYNVNGRQRVYTRTYKTRKNNPLETQIEISNQSLLASSIPNYTERVQVYIQHGTINIRPLPNHTFSIRKALRDNPDRLTALVAMTGGVDALCLARAGFEIDAVIEYRPHEKRDLTRDLTETGALNALANVSPRALVNQDISTIDWHAMRDTLCAGQHHAIAMISLQCDDFSAVKANSLKEKSIADLSTSRDLVYDALRMIETIRPATVCVENVTQFGCSSEGELLKIKLRRWGYHVTDAQMAAPDFGGLTRRTRYYLVASVFPDFQMPVGVQAAQSPIWSLIQPFLADCRDVSDSKALKDGLEGGRARLITPDSTISPTVLKSQLRCAKDSVWIAMPDGTYRFPSLELMKFLQGIPDDFNLDAVSKEVAGEIIGQSIDWPMHHVLVRAIHDHIGQHVGRHTATIIKQKQPA